MFGVGRGELSLSARYSIASAGVFLAGALIIGSWVVDNITAGVTQNSAVSTALLVDGLIAPLASELETTNSLSIGQIRALDELIGGETLGGRLISMRIWTLDGRVAYSNDVTMIGETFEPSPAFVQASLGSVVAELDELDEPESSNERALGLPLLEIYSPIRQRWTGDVIAVAEFYEDATQLTQVLREARYQSWLVVGLTTAGMALILFGMVHNASRLIDRQTRELRTKMDQTAAVSEQNRALRERMERAYSLSTELNERYLRRVSADLHDGPAQLVGLASLRVGSLADGRDVERRTREAKLVQQVLGEAMTDIRTICSGLSLPHIEKQSLSDIASDVVRAHERRTETSVDLSVTNDTADLSNQLKICVYRFIQEGLNNAYSHAAGCEQAVTCHIGHGVLHVSVTNGPFKAKTAEADTVRGLGLEGIQGRVETLGGRFHFEAFPETGARLEMSVRIGGEGQ